MHVPFLNLKLQYESIRDEIQTAINQVIEESAFAGGPFVAEFEEEFARFCNCEYAAGVGSGTEAIWLPLVALGIGPGDEVITVPNTFIATAEAISYCGATPVFVDVDEDTYNMNPELLEAAVTAKTRAIIPVHLFGQMTDMEPVMEIARKYGLFVIEDACQAHGSEYKGKRAGSIGDAGAFSFYPGKNLGAYGEAGAIVTGNQDLAVKIQMLRDHGQIKKYHHGMIGWNARMDGIQGAVLNVKLRHLESWNESRRKMAQLYGELLSNSDGIITPKEADYAKHVYHIYAIRLKKREDLMARLAERHIYCGIHYPLPVHLQDAYSFMGLRKGSFPVAEKCAEEFISLPMYPELTLEQVEHVAEEVNQFIQS
jgi:dTDP-4-amino-4,6-dideoxygalactose transaminase